MIAAVTTVENRCKKMNDRRPVPRRIWELNNYDQVEPVEDDVRGVTPVLLYCMYMYTYMQICSTALFSTSSTEAAAAQSSKRHWHVTLLE